MSRRIRRPRSIPSHPDPKTHVPQGGTLRSMTIGSDLPDVEVLEEELEEYMDILLGRVQPPIDEGVLTLQEVADALYARANEIEYLIHKQERTGAVFKGSSYYKFRTRQLRAFQEIARKAAELGSRRLTKAKLLHEMERDAQNLDFGWD